MVLTTVALVCLLSIMGVSKSGPEWTTQSRARGCTSNANSIDKCVGVWESQYVAIPTDRDIWIDIGSDGLIKRLSPDMAAWVATAAVPANARLVVGSHALFDYTRDTNVFTCPERARDFSLRERSLAHIHYRWWCGPADRRSGKTRGTRCFYYSEVGTREDPEKVHRL